MKYNLTLLEQYNQNYKGYFPFLYDLKTHWIQNKPLKGLKILHNIPITFETLIKIESLVASGADLTVCAVDLFVNKEVTDVLKMVGVTVIPQVNSISGEFDLGLDCACGIPNLPNVGIKRGYVELTQSGTVKYKKMKINTPVISVDDSYLKNLESMLGTGEAFSRALKQFLPPIKKDNLFVMFGFGKIGRGVYKFLHELTDNIIIIEKNETIVKNTNELGIKCIAYDDDQEVKKICKQAFGIIMATGVKNLLSRDFDLTDVDKHTVLINMGAEDEYGENFPANRVMGNKQTFNFLLDNPTKIEYIDPIFAAHNICAQYIINSPKLDAGYHSLPAMYDIPYVKRWGNIYNEDVKAILK